MYVDGAASNTTQAYAETDSPIQTAKAGATSQAQTASSKEAVTARTTGDAVSLSSAALALASKTSVFGDGTAAEDTREMLQKYIAELKENSPDFVETMLQVMKSNHDAALKSGERSAKEHKELTGKAMQRAQEGRQEEAEASPSMRQDAPEPTQGIYQETPEAGRSFDSADALPNTAQAYGKTRPAHYQGASPEGGYKASV